MEIRLLGPSALRVSRLCLGTATFGNPEWGSDEADSAIILGRYLDAGGNFLDTANKYADGESERTLGRLLRGRRDQVVLATKFTASMDAADANSSGNQRKNLVQSLEASLRRLDTGYVDILWVHAWDGVTPIDELMRALDDQVRLGKVLSVGISNAPSWMIGSANALAQARGWSAFTAVQSEYNLLERGAERELLPMTGYFGLAFLAWAPIGQGRLTGKYATGSAGAARRLTPDEVGMSEAAHHIVAETVAVAAELGCSPATVAIGWILAHRPEIIPVLGARTLEQLTDNLACLELDLPAPLLDRLTAASAAVPGSPAGFLRQAEHGFMWGDAGVPPRPALVTEPWWERVTLAGRPAPARGGGR
jgi:aryl-alcohol dehydrogenase-like predicted oxidoreductase